MAWTNKYCNLDLGAGAGGNGLAPGTAWTILSAALNVAAEDYVWTKGAIDVGGAGGVPLYVIANTGNIANNTKIVFHGYNTTYGDAEAGTPNLTSDMDFGEDYYQSPLDALINGVTLSKSASIGSDGSGKPIFLIDGKDNIVFKNFYLHNGNSATMQLVTFANTPVGVCFDNCKFTDAWRALIGTGDGVSCINCFADNSIASGGRFSITGSGTLFAGNVIKGVAAEGCLSIRSGVAIGNLLIDGVTGFYIGDGEPLILNNTCYNQTVQSVQLDAAAIVAKLYNNIFMPAVGAADNGIVISANGGTVLYNDYNCYYAVDGALSTPIITAKGGGIVPDMGPNSVQGNPLFADAANNDFRLKPGSPCLNTGKPNEAFSPGSVALTGGFSTIGAYALRQGILPRSTRVGV